VKKVRTCAALAALAGVLAAPAAASAAEQLAGVTEDNTLVLVRSDAPGNVRYAVPITNLPSGEHIVGLDTRPATGALYGLGASSRVYRIDIGSGNATAVGNPFTPLLDGSQFGFTFNPVNDNLREVSNNRQNLVLNANTGQVATTGTPLQYAAGDGGAGATPSVVAAAYSNGVAGATSTTLYDIDAGRDVLTIQDPPNDGTLKTVGALGLDVTGPGGFDISPTTGTGYAVLRRQGQTAPELFTINLTTGAATAVGPLAAKPANTVGASAITAIAALGQVADDRQPPGIVIALSSTLLETTVLNKGIPIKIGCDEACSVTATAEVDSTKQQLGTTTGEVVGGPGAVDVSVPLDANGKALVNRPGTLRLHVSFTIKDSAGNTVTSGRVVRTQTIKQRIG